MENVRELLIWSAVQCDIYDAANGSWLTKYVRNSQSLQKQFSRKTLSVLNEHYMIGARGMAIYVWNFHDPRSERATLLPGLVSFLVVSNCGTYVAASVGTEVYLWEVCSGVLLGKISASEEITCIRFDMHNNFLFIGCKTGTLISGILGELISEKSREKSTLKHYTEHSLKITDIYAGVELFATTSEDKSCVVYDVCTRRPLSTIFFDYSPMAVVMDTLEQKLIVGDNVGSIYIVNSVDVRSKMRIDSEKIDTQTKAHWKPVKALSFSKVFHDQFMSACENECKIWNVETLECLQIIFELGTFQIWNAFLSPVLPGLVEKDTELLFPIPAFQTSFNRTKPGEYPSTMIGLPKNDKLVLPCHAIKNQVFSHNFIANNPSGKILACKRGDPFPTRFHNQEEHLSRNQEEHLSRNQEEHLSRNQEEHLSRNQEELEETLDPSMNN